MMLITLVLKGFGEMQRRVDIGHEDTRLQTYIVILKSGCIACLPTLKFTSIAMRWIKESYQLDEESGALPKKDSP